MNAAAESVAFAGLAEVVEAAVGAVDAVGDVGSAAAVVVVAAATVESASSRDPAGRSAPLELLVQQDLHGRCGRLELPEAEGPLRIESREGHWVAVPGFRWWTVGALSQSSSSITR